MKKYKKTLVYLAVAIFFGFGVVIINRLLHNLNPFTLETVVFGITNLPSILIVIFLFEKILDNNSKKSATQLKRRLIPTFILTLLATTSIVLCFYFFGNFVYFLINEGQTETFRAITSISKTATICLFAGLFVCCIVFFYTTWHQAIEREQKLREENLKYRYRTLKTQVNPHFLFNSLNTLSEIVYVDAKKADNYIRQLSGIYRYILDNEEIDLIPLDKEIEFVEQYFDLQKERDANKIQLEIDIKNADKFKIVPISLQILIENALKHNVISKEKPLKIHIICDDSYISISNNIQRKSVLSNSSGLGLPNLKERIKLITGKEMVINQENNQFIVRLPLVRI